VDGEGANNRGERNDKAFHNSRGDKNAPRQNLIAKGGESRCMVKRGELKRPKVRGAGGVCKDWVALTIGGKTTFKGPTN